MGAALSRQEGEGGFGPRHVLMFLVVAAAYAATATAGLRWSVVPGAGTSVWPAAGIAFAALVLGGLRYWPAVFVGRVATAILVNSPTPLWADLLIAGATTLGAVVPAWAVRRAGGLDPKLGSFRAMLWLTLGGAALGAFISATFGAIALLASGMDPSRVAGAFQNWASGFFVGVLCFAPLLLAWSDRDAWRMRPLAWAHLALCLAAVALLASFIFLTPENPSLRTWHILPVLVWAALAFNVRGISAALLIVSLLALAGAAQGTGPLAADALDPIHRVLLTQQFVALNALTMLFLAAISDERRDVLGHARLAAIVSTSPEAIVTTDATGVLQSWNRGAEQLFGWPAAEAVGRPIVGFLVPEPQAEEGNDILRRVLNGETLRYEARRRTRTGELIDVAVTTAPLRTRDGTIVGISSLLRDIRKRKAAQAALRRLNEELEARVEERTRDLRLANASLKSEIEGRRAAEAQVRQLQKMEAVGQLTGGIAHDFNNMLAIVIGGLDLLKRRLKGSDPDALRLVNASYEGASRAAQLTAQLLAFSRRQALSPRVLDVGEQVERMSDLLRRTLGETSRIEVAAAGDLWPVRADATQLESALLNLAVNARDAMPGGGRLAIRVENARLGEDYAAAVADAAAGDHVLIAVSDTGTGMTPEILERVFEPFFTTKDVGKGTGLGLSMVYGFVRQSGGHLNIQSAPGEGTSVRVYLPRWAGEADTELSAGPEEAVQGALETVLVVEDEEQVRALAVEMLGALGYRVLEAEQGEAALAMLEREGDIALLITDVVMPDVNGRELVERARRGRPDLRALYITGYARDVVDAGGGDMPLLTKPFTIEQLGAKVRATLDG